MLFGKLNVFLPAWRLLSIHTQHFIDIALKCISKAFSLHKLSHFYILNLATVVQAAFEVTLT